MPVLIPVNQSLGGETGVHAHINTLRKYLEVRGVASTILSPYESSWAKRKLLGAVLKVMRPIQKSTRLRVQIESHVRLLRSDINRYLKTNPGTIVYAQDPVAAEASLTLPKGYHHRTVAVVHFNVSQADENVERKLIKPRDATYRSILERERQTLLAVDGIVYVSAFMKTALENRIPGLSQKKSVVIPNFISDTCRLQNKPTGDLVSIGTLEVRKNHEYTLQVLAIAHSRGFHYRFDIFGKGPDEDRLKKIAEDLGISSSVRFLGFIADARRILGDYRIYVHSALMENLPVSLIESLCAGIPILAAAVGGIPEVFHQGSGGDFWPLDNPEAGADKLIALLENAEDYDRQSVAARQRFEDHFAPEKLSNRLISFLEEVNGGFPESKSAIKPLAEACV